MYIYELAKITVIMTKYLFILIILFVAEETFSQPKYDTIIFHQKEFSNEANKIILSLPDTLNLRQTSLNPSTQTPLEKNMPWLVALLIGVLSAFVNFWLSLKQRKSNENMLISQLANAKEISQTQFKSTLATKNRQDWVNDLRHSLSEFLINSAFYTPDFTHNKSVAEIKEVTEKIGYTRYKIELLLNKNKPDQRRLLDAVEKMSQLFLTPKDQFENNDYKKNRVEIMDAASALFEIQWKKIKSLV